LGGLQGQQLQEQQQQQQQQQLTSAADRQHLEACYGLQDSSPNSSSLQEASTSSATTKRYLCYFLHRLLDFRVPELVALADMYGVPDVRCEAPAGPNGDVCPFWYVHLPNDQVAAQIVARAVLTRVSCCCCLDAGFACVHACTGQLRSGVMSCFEGSGAIGRTGLLLQSQSGVWLAHLRLRVRHFFWLDSEWHVRMHVQLTAACAGRCAHTCMYIYNSN
jgi:hypothetical protein